MKIKSTFSRELPSLVCLRFLDDFSRDDWIEIQREVLDVEHIDIAIVQTDEEIQMILQ